MTYPSAIKNSPWLLRSLDRKAQEKDFKGRFGKEVSDDEFESLRDNINR